MYGFLLCFCLCGFTRVRGITGRVRAGRKRMQIYDLECSASPRHRCTSLSSFEHRKCRSRVLFSASRVLYSHTPAWRTPPGGCRAPSASLRYWRPVLNSHSSCSASRLYFFFCMRIWCLLGLCTCVRACWWEWGEVSNKIGSEPAERGLAVALYVTIINTFIMVQM